MRNFDDPVQIGKNGKQKIARFLPFVIRYHLAHGFDGDIEKTALRTERSGCGQPSRSAIVPYEFQFYVSVSCSQSPRCILHGNGKIDWIGKVWKLEIFPTVQSAKIAHRNPEIGFDGVIVQHFGMCVCHKGTEPLA